MGALFLYIALNGMGVSEFQLENGKGRVVGGCVV